MSSVVPIKALHDNYIWTIVHPKKHLALVVDPGEAQPVLAFLSQQKLKLTAILVTHYHRDHIGGIEALYQQYTCAVYGPALEAIPYCQHSLQDQALIYLEDFGLHFNIMHVPGHTLGHVTYHNDQWLFCGDTLFAGGCGRVFEGSHEQMYHSLKRLAALPSHLAIYCAHEYTLNNLAFALKIEPDNKTLIQRIARAKQTRALNLPTVPSCLALEKKTNPFLRCDQKVVQQAAHITADDPKAAMHTFAIIREMKDHF